MLKVELFSKKDCCLCDEAKAIMEKTLVNFPEVELVKIDIEKDPTLFDLYKEKIPVVKINGKEEFIYKVHPVTFVKKLEKILNNP